MFRPLWEHGRAIVFADGWFEWKQQNGVKQPFFIYRKDGSPFLLAAIREPPFENGNDQEGSLVVTTVTNEGLLDIHNRRPLVYSPATARKWLGENTTGKEAEDTTCEDNFSAGGFTWHSVSRAAGNPRSQDRELIEPLAWQTEIYLASTHRVMHRFCR